MALLTRDECYALELASRMGAGSCSAKLVAMRGGAHRDSCHELMYCSPVVQVRHSLSEGNTGLRESFCTPLASDAPLTDMPILCPCSLTTHLHIFLARTGQPAIFLGTPNRVYERAPNGGLRMQLAWPTPFASGVRIEAQTGTHDHKEPLGPFNVMSSVASALDLLTDISASSPQVLGLLSVLGEKLDRIGSMLHNDKHLKGVASSGDYARLAWPPTTAIYEDLKYQALAMLVTEFVSLKPKNKLNDKPSRELDLSVPSTPTPLENNGVAQRALQPMVHLLPQEEDLYVKNSNIGSPTSSSSRRSPRRPRGSATGPR